MRILKTVILMIVSVLIGLSCLTVTSLAVSPVIPSLPLEEVEIPIETLIAQKAPKEKVEEQYRMFSVDRPETFAYDPSRYLLIYNASHDFWKTLPSTSYEDLVAGLAHPYPDVYIPFYGDGDTADRVIGSAKLAHDSMAKDWSLRVSIHNVPSQSFKDKTVVDPYEYITDYLAQSEKAPQQVFLLCHFGSTHDGHETVAVLRFETETVILDISNSAHVDGQEEKIVPTAYTVEEFRALRLAAEESTDGTSDGGQTPSQGDAQKGTEAIWLILVFALVVVSGVVAFVVIRKRRAKE